MSKKTCEIVTEKRQTIEG